MALVVHPAATLQIIRSSISIPAFDAEPIQQARQHHRPLHPPLLSKTVTISRRAQSTSENGLKPYVSVSSIEPSGNILSGWDIPCSSRLYRLHSFQPSFDLQYCSAQRRSIFASFSSCRRGQTEYYLQTILPHASLTDCSLHLSQRGFFGILITRPTPICMKFEPYCMDILQCFSSINSRWQPCQGSF
jgi:hypothetical protein